MNPDENILKIARRKNRNDLTSLFIYLERYINDGSPSGFDLGLPDEYSPFSKAPNLDIPVITGIWTDHLQIGMFPLSLVTSDDKIPFLIHPLLGKELKTFGKLIESSNKQIKVQPTASGRTVFWSDKNGEDWFIKLHFPLKLGRFNRELNLFRWLSALEKSRELYVCQNIFPPILGFFYDAGGTLYRDTDSGVEFGTIFREVKPIPSINGDMLLIPSFSLFAIKRNDGRKQSILADFIEELDLDTDQFLIKFINPLIDAYIFLVNHLGIIPECNAQNVVYEFNLSDNSTRVIIRDLGDCFVDFEIRKQHSLHTNFCSYKTLDPIRDKDIFQRRSFAFDFKLTYYILQPLIQEYSTITGIRSQIIIDKVKVYFQSNFSNHSEYFKYSTWFSYPNEEGVNRNSYIENENPLFR